MAQMKRVEDGSIPSGLKSNKVAEITPEEHEDRVDYYVATEAIDEALESGGLKRTGDFAKELGFNF